MTKPTVSKHWTKPVGRQRSGLNPTRTTPPCYNNTTLGNRLYAQRKGPNLTNQICLTCKNCSHKCAADCEHCHTNHHRAILIIFPLNLQTISITRMLSSGGEGGKNTIFSVTLKDKKLQMDISARGKRYKQTGRHCAHHKTTTASQSLQSSDGYYRNGEANTTSTMTEILQNTRTKIVAEKISFPRPKQGRSNHDTQHITVNKRSDKRLDSCKEVNRRELIRLMNSSV